MAIIKDGFFPTPYSMYMFLGTYLVLCLTYVAFGLNLSTEKLSKKLAKMVLKGLPVLFLIVFFVYSVSSVHVGPVQTLGRDIDDLPRVFFGLVFSFLGDCYLMFDSLFVHGLLAFACTQLIYVALFGGRMLLVIVPSYGEIMAAMAVSLVSVWVYCYIFPKLSRVLVVAAALYCILISLMLWCALVTLMQDAQLPKLQGAIGACLFYTSDLLLTLNRWGPAIPYGPNLVMATYYAAQVFIFLSVINAF